MSKESLYLIDATAFCYRAFYGLRNLTTSSGQPTNAIYGFINMLLKVLKDNQPELLAVCFDVSRDTFRLKKFAEYKIQRPPMPDGLSSQIPLIKEIVRAMGFTIVEKQGYEADDVIACLADRAKKEGIAVVIVSSDKDILQLVDENTKVFSPYKDEGTWYDQDKVIERFGVAPVQMTDIIALMGDDADNIPGVPGIGEKTAAELIRQFGNIDKLLDGINQIKQEKIRKSVSENIEGIKLSRELAVLVKDFDLDVGLGGLKIKEADFAELFRLYKHLEFKSLLKDLPVSVEKIDDIEVSKIKYEEINELAEKTGEICLYLDKTDNIFLSIGGKIFQADRIEDNLKRLFSNAEIKKTSHDLKQIKMLLAKENIALKGLYFDTMIAGYLVNPSKPGYKLHDLSWDFLKKVVQETSLDAKLGIDLIRQLRPKLEQELKEKALFNLFREVEMPLVDVLAEMEMTGIKLDVEVIKELSVQVENRLIGLIEDIYKISECQFNINSPKQLREILFEKLKLPVVKKSKTGPSTDEEVLHKLASKHKLPALLLEYRQLMKLKTTYIDTLPNLVDKDTERIHASFNQAVTETGRLSSSNPNLQNIPIKTDIGRNIRRAVIAFDKTSCLLSCDYSQIELRILAHLSHDESLMEAFKEDKDIHKSIAALIHGVDELDVTTEMRDTAKRVNFGIIYGLTSFGLSRDLGISHQEAQNFIDSYFLRYPKVKDYIQEQIELAKKTGFVSTILGRRRYIPEINNKNQVIRQLAERQAVNTPIQGSASDLIKLAMVHIHEVIKSQGLKSRLIMQIHDELVFDVPDKEMHDFKNLVKERMENVLKLEVPIKVDTKTGNNWLKMKE